MVFLLVCFFFYKGLLLIRSMEAYTDIISRRTGYPLIVFEDSLPSLFWIEVHHYIVRHNGLCGISGFCQFF